MVGTTSVSNPRFFIFSRKKLDDTKVYRFNCFFSRWSFQCYPVEVYFYQGSSKGDKSSNSFSSYILEGGARELCFSDKPSQLLEPCDIDNDVCLVDADFIPDCICNEYATFHKVLFTMNKEYSISTLTKLFPVSQGYPYRQETKKGISYDIPALINGEYAPSKIEWPELSFPLVVIKRPNVTASEENASEGNNNPAEIQGPEEEHKDSDEVSPVYSDNESERYCNFQSETEPIQQVTSDTSALAVEEQPKYDERDYSLQGIYESQGGSDIPLETLNLEIEPSGDAPPSSQGTGTSNSSVVNKPGISLQWGYVVVFCFHFAVFCFFFCALVVTSYMLFTLVHAFFQGMSNRAHRVLPLPIPSISSSLESGHG